MKKLACLLLSVLMILTLGVNVFAAVEGEDDANINTEDIFDPNSAGGNVDDGEFGADDIFGSPSVTAENTTAYKGDTVTVDLKITKNPGFTDMVITIAGEGVTVTAVANGDKGTATLSQGKIIISSDEEIAENICVAKVTLTVGEQLGDITVGISVTAENGDAAVAVTGKEFKITVKEESAVWGDVNNSGVCDTTDLALLKLLLANARTEGDPEIVFPDVDGDTFINTTDLAKLKLFLAGAQV